MLLVLLDKIRHGKISLADAKKDQEDCEKDLREKKKKPFKKIKRAKKTFVQY